MRKFTFPSVHRVSCLNLCHYTDYSETKKTYLFVKLDVTCLQDITRNKTGNKKGSIHSYESLYYSK